MDKHAISHIFSLVKKPDFAQAGKFCFEYCQQSPNDCEAQSVYGMLCNYIGQYASAEAVFRRMLAGNPQDACAYFNLGRTLAVQQKLEGAEAAFREALRFKPDMVETYSNYAALLRQLDRPLEAIELYHKAEKLSPDFLNINIHLLTRCETAEKIAEETLKFHSIMSGNCLFLLSYNVIGDEGKLLAESLRWDAQYGAQGRSKGYQHDRGVELGKRLRIGYVSPDFRKHSVSYFFEPLLRAHDRAEVEVFCYAEVSRSDEVTERIKAVSDGWRLTVGQSDQQVAAQIKADDIDVLVDLAGHTSQNRLGVFTYKPAPVQLTYLGYFATTGLAAMDYWLTDEVLTPEDTVEQSAEDLWRLPRCCVSYTGPAQAPAVMERALEKPVVFGNFNDLSKAGPGSVESWAEILRRVPGSSLLLKARQLGDESVRRAWWKKFEALGVAQDRVVLRGRTAGLEQHLAMYGEVDICLDTMPRTGGTTTAEALWMGVPVVSLAGGRFVERLSATMLAAVGLDDLVTLNRDLYIEKAVEWAGAGEKRRALRATLRQRLQDSELCNHADLARSIEGAYRAMRNKFNFL